MVHTLLIGGHAAAGLAALIAGCMTIRRGRAVPVYLGSVAVLVAFLIAALAAGWPGLGTGARATFTALTLLAVYVLWRAVQAALARQPGTGPASARFLDHLGFTLIALLVGFVVVAVLDLGSPVWLVVLAAMGCIAAGHLGLRHVKAREAQRPDTSAKWSQHLSAESAGAAWPRAARPPRDRRHDAAPIDTFDRHTVTAPRRRP